MKTKNSGFTLIELLIVVAIIAILAAIAVPNFLEAQVRSKVSRAKSDLRTLITGIESYTVDYNSPPREYSVTLDGALQGQTNASGIMSPVLSTPVAYLTTALILDPFVNVSDNIDPDQKYFSFCNVHQRDRAAANGGTAFSAGQLPGGTQADRVRLARETFGNYYVMSIGPDRNYYNNAPRTNSRNGITGREYIVYDPTNGTVSFGNIYRGQKIGFDSQPRTPDVISAH